MKRQALMMLLIILAALAWVAPLTARQQSPAPDRVAYGAFAPATRVAPLTARQQSPAPDQQSFPPPAAAFIGRTAQIPMRDGQSLAADIYLPKNGGKHPVALIQTPYNKTLTRNWWRGEGRWGANSLFTDPNYVFVVTDY